MDRISGLMPQVGWSPLLAVTAPKKAPATTVEPAAKAANTNGGMGANVNTQAQPEKVVQLQARTADATLETAVLAQSRAAEQPDPDAPTGPPPSFDVTPLEAQAAAMRTMPKDQPGPKYPPGEAAAAQPADMPAQAEAPESPEATAPEAPEPAPVQTDWQAASEAPPEPQVDMTA